jgi:hypothetical protein
VLHTAENSKDKPVIGRPFRTGDGRINRRGRPRNFDAFRELAQAIAHETTTDKNGNVITIAERILRSWAESKEPMLQRSFIEYAFGKPPDKIETNLAPKTTLRLYFAHEEPGWQQPGGAIIGVNGEGTRRPLLPDAD